MRRLDTTLRTDWFRILTDLAREQWTHKDVAEHLAIPPSTLLGWKAGSEPKHADGERLLDLWRAITKRERGDRPLTMC